MTQITNTTETTTTQQKVYDHLFIAIFGKDTERSKRWRLELYNALNNTNYTDPDALELNTLKNVLFIKMHNDVSFLVDSQMTLFEHQRTTNQNMPLRGFFYFAQLYHKYLINAGEELISSTLIKIPNPNYVVFTMEILQEMRIMRLNCQMPLCKKIKVENSSGLPEY